MRETLVRGFALRDVETDELPIGISKGQEVHGQLVFNERETCIVGELIEATDEYIAVEYWIPVDPKTIGRFTGLLTTGHTKECPDDEMIFTGDILKFDCYDFGDQDWYEKVIEVKDTIRDLYYLEQEMRNSNLSKCFRVIGNIYKTPELLEVTLHEQ